MRYTKNGSVANGKEQRVVAYELRRREFTVSTEKARLQLDVIVAFLARAYWSQGRTRDVIERSIAHSLCFGLYAGDLQIGFARVVTDCATFAYLCDVFVDERYRGQGLGKWLMEAVMGHPDLQGLRRWTLATRDAHGLYKQFGWTELRNPGRWMEIYNPPPVP
jgi:GNAT superfamily N-acetyltransferase